MSHDNSVYLTGYIAGNKSKIQDTTINYGNFSFLAKYDTTGDLKWLKRNNGVEGTDVAINRINEIYTAFTTEYTECNILKFDEDGNVLWNKMIPYIDRITSINVDKMDNLILTGHYNAYKDSLIIEDTVIYNISENRTNSFVMKYNSNGEFEWFNTTKIISGSGGYVVFHDIQSDNNGDIFAIGDYELYAENDSLQIGNFYLNSESNPAYAPYYFSHKDIVLTKLDSKGKFLWAKKFGGYEDDLGNKLAVNKLGEVFIVGNFINSINFDDINLTTNGVDIYFAKVSALGDIEWVNKLGGNCTNCLFEEGRTVALSDSSVYIGGMYPGSFFYFESTNIEDTIINFSSSSNAGFIANYSFDGDFIAVHNLKSTDTRIEDINVNGEHIYITGNFYPPSTFLNTTIPIVYSNTNHFFLASLNTNSITYISTTSSNRINFYPNPAQDHIIVELNNEFNNTISIYDLNGSILLSQKCFDVNNKVDITSLKSGLYILKVNSNNKSYVDRFIKY